MKGSEMGCLKPLHRDAAALLLAFAMLIVCGGSAPGIASSEERGPDFLKARKAAGPGFVILAWNNLGMHCYNRDYSDMAVLPPYNTLWAQVIRVGDPPQIVTSGITIQYNFPLNTSSANKTNFWQYAKQLFGVDLPLNVGMAGKGLSGVMDLDGDHFIAEGIPLTEYSDSDAKGRDPLSWNRHPFQLALLTVRDSMSNAVLARNVVVAPVSSELSCDMCHADDGDATTRYPIVPTGNIATNILTLHDFLNQGQYATPLMNSRPVLCASCHSSNALGTQGAAGVKSLSNAMHFHHKDLPDITPNTEGCYNCHPGATTQCLRDSMSQNFSFNCLTCHGTMETVAQNPDPWLNEPRCDSATCHGAGFALDTPLYRESKGHGGMYCATCHDSPHAIAPSRESSDGIKLVLLQQHVATEQPFTQKQVAKLTRSFNKFVAQNGNPGTLRDCTVCHLSRPSSPFRHHQ
ncbi:MAG: hypothetical protein NTZ78_08760 [Candidatus Aureabacteria bacterium]|nr:hypothetical protein [Candidatus Auribacterota bacterium]